MKILFFGAKSYDIKSFVRIWTKKNTKIWMLYTLSRILLLRQQCWRPVMKPCVHS